MVNHKYSTKAIILFIALLGATMVLAGFENIKFMSTDGTSYAYENVDNRPIIITESIGQAIVAGNIQGTQITHKFGDNPDIDTGGFESIWHGGGDYAGFDANTSRTVTIVSTNNNDNWSQSGAWQITVQGLNGSYDMVEETINLTGTTPVTTTQDFLRLYRAWITYTGNSDFNEGDITITQTIDANVQFATIPIGEGQTHMAVYTISNNNNGYIQSWYASLASKNTGYSTVKLQKRLQNQSWRTMEIIAISSEGSSYIQRIYETPKDGLPSGTDIQVVADSSVNNMGIAAGFDIIQIEEQ